MTSISEEVLDNPINISKFKFTCDDADETIPKPLPQQGGFAMLIIGKPRSGKTNLLLNLTTKAHKNFNRKFDKVFLFSPSVNTMENDPFELLPEDQKFEVATQENLIGVLDTIKDTGEKVLMILDDCISDIRGKGKSEIENLLHRIFFNRRHLAGKGGSLSIIATSQTYNKIDPKLRKTASHLVFFENKNKKELDSIFEEVILIPKKEFYDVLRYIFDKKYQFMYVDTTLPDYKMIHKNFNQLEVKSPNILGNNYFANAEI
ncbi:MAG: hypothetical protein CMM62_20570 [Rhodospirillaceae bacterium]|jgi:hypothetical protein|nr:hypothetical protein [Rhodospirillaceae bacterium]|tara:strand:+ start:155 stop:937 length:783 start_codon:yes stop_codon:yes gene_type:complete